MNITPFEWNELTDEEKLARVMKALIYKETFIPCYHDIGVGTVGAVGAIAPPLF